MINYLHFIFCNNNIVAITSLLGTTKHINNVSKTGLLMYDTENLVFKFIFVLGLGTRDSNEELT